MNELVSACAKRDRASRTKYGRVWQGLISCVVEILRSGRGAQIPQLGSVTYVTRSQRESVGAGHKGCVFVTHPNFIRTYSIVQLIPPKRALMAPSLPVSPARVAHAVGMDHEYTQVAMGSIVDAIGRRACSGASLRLPFGAVGTLLVKGRTLRFAFARGFRRPKMDSSKIEGEYDTHVRRILGVLEKEGPRVSTAPGNYRVRLAPPATATGRAPTPGARRRRSDTTERKSVVPPETGKVGKYEQQKQHHRHHHHHPTLSVAEQTVAATTPTTVAGPRSAVPTARSSSRSSARIAWPANTDGAAAAAAATTSTTTRGRPKDRHLSSGATRAAACAPVVGGNDGLYAARDAMKSIAEGAISSRHGGAAPLTPAARAHGTIVAAGTKGGETAVRAAAASAAAAMESETFDGGVQAGGEGMEAKPEEEISPRAAKKVLPHFLAIGKSGSQALVPKEGAEIVQRQAMARFDGKKAALKDLNEAEDADMRRRQVLKWKEYEERQLEERRRLRGYLQAVKKQAEAQKIHEEKERARNFMADNPDPNPAYPCRIEYNTVKENEWRRAWCSDLEAQVGLKQRMKRETKQAEVARDHLRAVQLAAAIKADRVREIAVQKRDLARIHRQWAAQVASSSYPQRGNQRNQSVMLDKIVR